MHAFYNPYFMLVSTVFRPETIELSNCSIRTLIAARSFNFLHHVSILGKKNALLRSKARILFEKEEEILEFQNRASTIKTFGFKCYALNRAF